MNNKISFNNLNKISLTIFFILSIFIIPINYGFAAESSSISEIIQPNPKTVENIENTCGTPVNVKDSLIMSVVTLCIPGILEKVKEWKEISCEAAVCKYNAIKGGIDPSFCEKQKEYKFCKFVWGEIFSVPPLTIIEMYKDMIKELIANPVGILYGYAVSTARTWLSSACPGSCTGITVGAVATGLFVVDLTGTIQTFEDMAENGFNGGKTEQNFCEQARDIKIELEEVIETYKIQQSLDGDE
jgi:hypothetical protein